MHAQRRPLANGDGFFTHLAGDAAVAWSGGSEPGNEVNPAAVEAMSERGIDISGEYPKPWTDEIVQAADVVITMGCGDACPVFPGRRYEDWVLHDPAGQDLDGVRPIRDDIERTGPTACSPTCAVPNPCVTTPAPHRRPLPLTPPPVGNTGPPGYIGHTIRSIIDWLRAGYPDEAPRTGYSPLLALNGPIALSARQTEQIVAEAR